MNLKDLDLMNYISNQDLERFEIRTNEHINRVQKFAGKIDDEFLLNGKLKEKVKFHDESKFGEYEKLPYVLITKRYWEKNNKLPITKYPNPVEDEMFRATFHHIKNNSHHPEFWDPKLTVKNLNKKDRDAIPEKMTNGLKMPDICIYEMCADWMAVSEEFGDSPLEWADKVVNKRFRFNKKQVKLIYRILERIWYKNV